MKSSSWFSVLECMGGRVWYLFGIINAGERNPLVEGEACRAHGVGQAGNIYILNPYPLEERV